MKSTIAPIVVKESISQFIEGILDVKNISNNDICIILQDLLNEYMIKSIMKD